MSSFWDSQVFGEWWFPIAIASAFFGLIFIVGPLCACGPDKNIIRVCIMLSAFCMWLFWLIVYMAQINPLFGPRLDNTSMIWIWEKWVEHETNKTKVVETAPEVVEEKPVIESTDE